MSERSFVCPITCQFPLINHILGDGHKAGNLHIIQIFLLVFTGEGYQISIVIEERIELVSAERGPDGTLQTIFWFDLPKIPATLRLSFAQKPSSFTTYQYSATSCSDNHALTTFCSDTSACFLEHLFQSWKKTFFWLVRLTVKRRLCSYCESCLNVYDVLLDWKGYSIWFNFFLNRRLNVFFTCCRVGYSSSGLVVILFWVFLLVNHYLMPVWIPVIIKGMSIGKFCFLPFFR